MRMVVVLPAPLGPRNPTSSPGRDLEVDVIDGQDRAVLLDEVVDPDRGIAHGASRGCVRRPATLSYEGVKGSGERGTRNAECGEPKAPCADSAFYVWEWAPKKPLSWTGFAPTRTTTPRGSSSPTGSTSTATRAGSSSASRWPWPGCRPATPGGTLWWTARRPCWPGTTPAGRTRSGASPGGPSSAAGSSRRSNIDGRTFLRRADDLFRLAPVRHVRFLDVGSSLDRVTGLPAAGPTDRPDHLRPAHRRAVGPLPGRVAAPGRAAGR